MQSTGCPINERNAYRYERRHAKYVENLCGTGCEARMR